MLFFWKFSILVAFLCSNVLSRKISLTRNLAERQFETLTSSCSGSLCPKTSGKSSSSTQRVSSSSLSSSSNSTSGTSTQSKTSTLSASATSNISSASSTTSATSTASYDAYRLTTTFTQPPECTGGYTEIADWGTEIYNNLIYSQSGFDLEYTSCFPPQFYSSVLASIASTTLGPFKALICPATWENYAINSTYVICCPKGYGLIAPNIDDINRPGAGAVCSSYIGGDAIYDITTFDVTGGQTTDLATAVSDGIVVWANAFDGITTSVFNASTSSLSLTFSSSTTTASSSSLTSTTSSNSSSSVSTSVSSISKTSSSIPISTSPNASSSTTKSSGSSTGATSSSSISTSSSKASSSSSSSLATSTTSKPISTSSSSLAISTTSKPISTSSSSQATSTTSKPVSTTSSPTPISTTKPTSSSTKVSTPATTTGTAIPGESNLPACGQLCFNNMLAQYASLGCNPLDAYCLCSNVNFGFGLRDCSNGACGTAVASTAIAFGSAYCSSATATHIPGTTTVSTAVPGESNLPACGQLCFNNMLAQYASLGCAPLDAYCLCSNVNFGFGLRDCSNGACGASVASTVIAFGSTYCASATATHTA